MNAREALRAQLPALLSLAAYTFFLQSLDGVQRPHLKQEFGLDDSGIAFLMGVVQLGGFGTLLLTREADRRGRRQVLLLASAGLPPLALVTAIAPGVASFALVQIAATALVRTLFGLIPVVISEEATDEGRPRAQAWFGVASLFGANLGLVAMAGLAAATGSWRWAWALAAAPALALPWLRRSLIETRRFERARERGRTQQSRALDLFRGPLRRRALGLLGASTLRATAIITTLSWSYYHAVENLALAPGAVSGLLLGGTLLGLLGIPIGARLTSAWGRRPTVVLASLVAVGSGIAFYWIPVGSGRLALLPLALFFSLSHVAMNAFNVGDRLVDTELFPTHLRATYTGWNRAADAVAGSFANFSVGALSLALGGLVPAISLLAPAALIPAVAIFLWTVPETRGLSLDVAALEDETPPRR
jgi:putative MFS transporter